MPAVAASFYRIVDNRRALLAADGSLVLTPRSSLRGRFPAEPDPTAAAATTPLSAEGFALLEGMLQPNPARRLGATAALSHPWFAAGAVATALAPDELAALAARRFALVASGSHAQSLAASQAVATAASLRAQAQAIAKQISRRLGR